MSVVECSNGTDCPHRYFAKQFPRVRDDAHFWEKQAKLLAAQVQQLKLDAEYRTYRDLTDVAWLQGKVVSQRRELKRLNDEANTKMIQSGLAIDPLPDVAPSLVTALDVSVTRGRPKPSGPATGEQT